MQRVRAGGCDAYRLLRNGELSHVTDTLEVVPRDVAAAHHLTSTDATAGPFMRMLMAGRFQGDGGHVMLTSTHRTVRVPGRDTRQEELDPEQVLDALRELGVTLTAADARGLLPLLRTERERVSR